MPEDETVPEGRVMIAPMPRIVAVLPSLAGGGAERVTLTLLQGLDPSRYRLHLVLLDGRGPLTSLLRGSVTVTDLQQPRLRRALPALLRVLQNLQPAVTFSSLGYVNLALAACRGAYPGRLVIREANLPSLALPQAPFPTLTRFGYRLLYRRADRILATSQRMADELSAFGIPAGRLSVLQNPVDVQALRAGAASPLRHPGRGPRFVAAGRLVEQKGFDRLIPQLSRLPQAQLTIFGDGPQQEALAALARACGADVVLNGFSDQVPRWFAGADAVVMPSRWEGLPNVALEALACGTPVIASPESGGITEIAAAAPPGAVKVSPVETGFLDSMRQVPIRPVLAEPMPSLLPADYASQAVGLRFASLIEELL